VVVVVILDRTWEFQAALVFSTTVEKAVPAGISLSRFWQACSFEIHEMPTREDTVVSLKVKRPPTYIVDEFELADPEGCTTLPPAAVPV
jgi:hypothetical protein